LYKSRKAAAFYLFLHKLTVNQILQVNNNHTYHLRCTIKMHYATILAALSFAIGAQAWAQSGNGEWIANDTKYYGFENARK
jgi:hypothetical protein